MLERNPDKSMADLRRELPVTYGSPSMSPFCADETKYGVVDQIVKKLEAMHSTGAAFAGQKIRDLVTVNGVRVVCEDGTWGLVRASSNEPKLVVVIESPVSEARKIEMFEAINAVLAEHDEIGEYKPKPLIRKILMLKLRIFQERFKLQSAFRISRGTKTSADIIRVEITDGPHRGNGECVPYARYGETSKSVTEQMNSIANRLEIGFSPDQLQGLLPAGAARNALDCALWDLKAKQTNTPVWQLAGLTKPGNLTTAYTLSLDSPSAMQAEARKHSARPLLKLKLGGAGDLERLQAVRVGSPNSRIIVDANEAWDEATWLELQKPLHDLGVTLIEQPLPQGKDDALLCHEHLIPVCADESCHTANDIDHLRKRYDFVNIKLDKTGGFTESIEAETTCC